MEPTTIEFRSDRVAIVGPNGCGKSNIIDAIRWVMGESSPKFLRGDLMADVIFNGSLHRKPMGLASVEIILDNTQNLLQGAYVKKGDVSLRREVNRSGESSYYINQQRVRRKDLSDLWLGTGAGARGYAIIGQNMVNQLVEANPEALKAYLEEAAGVSKYKERRKESATRLGLIHENIERISDIVSELSTQLERLAREANDAKQYHLLKQHLKEHAARLNFAKYNAIIQKQNFAYQQQTKELVYQNELSQQISSADTKLKDLDQLILHQQELVVVLEQEHYKLQMDLSQQAHLSLKHTQDKTRYTTEMTTLLQEIDLVEKDKAEQKLLLLELTDKQTILLQRQDELKQQTDLESNAFEKQEAVLKNLQVKKHVSKQELHQIETKIQVLKVKLEGAEQNIYHYKLEMQNTSSNQYADEVTAIALELKDINKKIEQTLLEHQVAQDQYVIKQLEYEKKSKDLTEAQALLNIQEQQYQSANKALISAQACYEGLLASMQKASTEIGKAQLKLWLESWQVPAIWQSVVDFLWQHFLPHGFVDIFESNYPDGAYIAKLKNMDADDSINLLAHFGLNQMPSGFFNWAGLKMANSSEQALLMRTDLQKHESIITPDGLWLGFDWHYQLSFEQQGLASKLQECKTLQKVFWEVEKKHQQSEQDVHARKLALETISLSLQSLDESQKKISTSLDGLKQKKTHLEQKQDFFKQEQIKKNNALQSLEVRYMEASELVKNCRLTSDELHAKQKQVQYALEEIMAMIQFEKSRSDKLLESLRMLRQTYENITQDLFKTKTQIDFLQQELPKLEKRFISLNERLIQVDAALISLTQENLWSPESMQHNKTLLKNKEEKLAISRQTLKDAHIQKQNIQKNHEDLKKKEMLFLEKKWRINVEKEQISRERQELEQSFLDLMDDAPWARLKPHEDEQYFKKKMVETEQSLLALGDVNLLALGLYDEERLRHDALLAQQQDLQHAMKELEQAIETLDLDMQSRLEMTLNAINEHLIHIFPQLFGGGQAKFVASCDNLLEATVSVNVQLPGKKQHRIQLLSGGEKALTAVALLFAIFSLNPAPFCLLDEVDAALDDANVQRLASLVRKLSETVQFVLITHNPLTMDAADDLVGVTMQEAGVSRVVSVNMAMALEMVNKE